MREHKWQHGQVFRAPYAAQVPALAEAGREAAQKTIFDVEGV